MDFARGGLGQFVDEHDMARILVLAEPAAHQVLDFFNEGFAAWPPGYNEGLDDLAAQRIGHTYRGGFAHIRMFQDGVFDLDRAHGPARRNDHIIGAAGMVEIAVAVDAAQVFRGHPDATAPDFPFAGDARCAGLARYNLDLHNTPRHGLTTRPGPHL